MLQKGILRTNCIDCLDRTNVAQYAYGLATLGQQLQALGLTDDSEIDLDDPIANILMGFYERMGDILALQYGGSAAHNKIFSERRGQWKPATHSQEFIRTLQRYYSNTYMDAEKQDAINVFLGHFQPQPDKPALWELDSDQDFNIGRHGKGFGGQKSRFVATAAWRQLFPDANRDSYFNSAVSEHSPGSILSSSNFIGIDWLSSSGNSCEDETYEGQVSVHTDRITFVVLS
ncbi:Phosphoinositide phosphatase [Nymphaea thermarum]|nr:Phosphoinositide phosphatase [Nymphaea thermarum]